MKHQNKICVLHAELTNKKKPQNTTECRSAAQKSGDSEQQQSCKIPSPRLSPCSLLLLSQFSSLLQSPSNPLAQEAQQSLICKNHVLLAHPSVWPKVFPARLLLRLLLSSLVFSQLQNSFHFQRFLSPLTLKFLRAGLKSWNVWCANHLH